MNDEDSPGAEEGDDEAFGQEAEPQQGGNIGLSGFMESIRRTSAWLNSIDRQFEPVRRQLRMVESTRRSIVDAMGPANAAYQAALDTHRQYRAITAPVLALQSELSDIHDWHRLAITQARAAAQDGTAG
ncbi:hypothetical protein [Streptomyces sp. GESEQ-35]|uniref:hypothetical protein n=1 Tax=Streptomyces sp. GESEQ-35 TaxID=2812657 RepID=UPI001B3327BA|nr:hypothetical protein [Streptomyces sp. GESEQ-35]